MDKQLRFLRGDLYGGRAPREPGVKARIDAAEDEVSRLRKEVWRLDDFVRGVSDAVVHRDGGLDPERDVQTWSEGL